MSVEVTEWLRILDRAELAERSRDEAVALLRALYESLDPYEQECEDGIAARAFLASFPQGGEA